MLDIKNGYWGRKRQRASGLGPDHCIAVCGAHRSGTTLLGSLLTADQKSLQLTEPFHPLVGVEGINQWYIAADIPGGEWKQLIDRFLAGESMGFSTIDGQRQSLWNRLKGTPRSRE